MRQLRAARDYIGKIRWDFLSLVLLIQATGLTGLYSATGGAYSSNSHLFFRQGLWLLAGWAVFFAFSGLHYRRFQKISFRLYILHIILLILTLILNKGSGGVSRWLDLGLFHYQPSETLNFSLALLAADRLSRRPFRKPLNYKELFVNGLLILLPVVLVMVQPDLGTAGLTLLTIGSLLLFNGVQRKAFLALSLCFLVSLPLAWRFVLKDYQKTRLTGFVQPQKDSQGAGYNVIQSKIAIGSGRLEGKGFTKGAQHRLQFLPERHTDFIFSVISEEWGFLGSLFTLGLFWAALFLILNSAGSAKDRLSCYLCLGAGSFVFWRLFINIAMTMGLFPVVGAPLPLMSYGGSHILTSMAFLGLVASVNRRRELFKN